MSLSKSQKYWEERFKQLEEASNKTGHETLMRIEPSFDEAQKAIQKEIEAWYGRYAINNGITMQEAKKQLTTRELREFRWDVNEYIKYGKENALNQQWMKELENASARVHVSRLEALKLRTQQYAEKAFGNELDELDSMARKLLTDDYYHACFEVQKGFNIGWELGQLDERKLDKYVSRPWAADGKNFSDRIWNSKAQLIDEVHKQLTQSCILGKAPDGAIQAISKKFNTSKSQAGRLVMTEQAYFHSVAQQEAFNDLDVEEYEIVATLDSQTSETCQEMDGKHFPMNEYKAGVTAPPFHVWCRSVTVPWFEDNYTGERAARNGDGKTYYVPDDMTYPEWKEYYVDGTKDPATWERKYKIDVKPKEEPKIEQRTMKKIDFTPAKTITEAEEYAKQFVKSNGHVMYGKKHVNYSGISVDMANEVNYQLTQLFGNYEVHQFDSIETFGKGQKKYFAQHGKAPMTTTNFGNLMINKEICKSEETISKYISDAKDAFDYVLNNMDRLSGSKLKLAETYKEAGRSLVGGTFKDMITHEFGHHVSYMQGVNKELLDVLKSSDWNKFAKHISGYANNSASEYLAESWVAYVKGEINLIDPELTKVFDGLRKFDIDEVVEDIVEEVIEDEFDNFDDLSDEERAILERVMGRTKAKREQSLMTRDEFINGVEACKDSEEVSKFATEYFRNKPNCNIRNVDMSKIDCEVLKKVVIKVDDLDSRFDSTLTALENAYLGLSANGMNSPNMEMVQRYLDTKGISKVESTIKLNDLFFGNEKMVLSDWNDNCNSKHIPLHVVVDKSDAYVTTIVHEYGHSILQGKLNEALIEQGGHHPAFEEILKIYDDYMGELLDIDVKSSEKAIKYAEKGDMDSYEKVITKADEKRLKICISRYSQSSVGEFIAEAFCDAELNKKPKKYSKRVYDVLVKYYGKVK